MTHDEHLEKEFPLECCVRIVAADVAGVSEEIGRVLGELGFVVAVLRGNASSGGRYISFHVSLTFATLALMRRTHAALAGIAEVKMVL